MQKNYRHGTGWAWPVDHSQPQLPPFVWSFCPWCGQDLPPLIDGEGYIRLWFRIWTPESESQADGEGEE